jgi:chemotaxis-related protein WspB
MLLVEFSIDDRHYGIDVSEVAGVIPLPPLRPLDLAPPYIAGVVSTLGAMVPVVDLCALHVGRPCRRVYGTRVILVRYKAGNREHRLGLAAEQVFDAAEVDPSQLQPSGVTLPDAPWLGPLARDDHGRLVQLVTLERLLPDDVRGLLFKDEGG